MRESDRLGGPQINKKANIISFGVCVLLGCMPKAEGAGEVPVSFSLEGNLYQSSSGSTPLLDPAAKVRVQITDPSESCIVYDEEQTVDTTATDGIFTIQVGSQPGDGKRVAGSDPGNSMVTVFQNRLAMNAASGSCGGGIYVPSTGATRKLRIIVTPSATNIADTLAPLMEIASVPTAQVASSLDGITRDGFLQIKPTANLTQNNLESIFTGSNYSTLNSLLAGGASSSTGNYAINAGTGGSGGIDFNINGSTRAGIAHNGDFAVDGTSLFVQAGSDRVGIGTSAPRGSLDLSAKTDALLLPNGSTAQRPSPAYAGMLRFNTSLGKPEIHSGSGWVTLGSDISGISAGGDLSGAFPNPAVAALAGYPLDGTAPVVGQSLRAIGGKWTAANLSLSDLTNSSNASAVGAANCTAGQTLYYNATDKALECQAIAAPATGLSGIVPVASGGTGAATTSQSYVFAGPSSGSGAPAFRQLSASDISGLTSSQWSNGASSSINYTAGNVGIGVTSPAAKLDISGASGTTIKIVDGNQASGKVLTSDANGVASWQTAAASVSGTAGRIPTFATSTSLGDSSIRDDGASIAVNAAVPGWLTAGSIYAPTQIYSAFLSAGTKVQAANVYGSAAASGSLTLDSTSDSTKGFVLVNPTGGYVGIGSSNPGKKLHVVDDGDPVPLKIDSNSGYGTGFYLDNSRRAGGRMWSFISGSVANGYFSFKDENAGANRLTIDTSGNVGIGTTSPGATLDVKGAIRMSGSTSGYAGFQPAAAAGSTVWTLPAADGTSGQILSTNGSGALSWVSSSGGTPAGSSGQIQYNNGGSFGATSGMIWDSTNSRLGIGTASPAFPLQVSSSTTATTGTLNAAQATMSYTPSGAGPAAVSALSGTLTFAGSAGITNAPTSLNLSAINNNTGSNSLTGILNSVNQNHSSGTTTTLSGIYNDTVNTNGTSNTIRSTYNYIRNAGAGSIGTAIGTQSDIRNVSGGSISTAIGAQSYIYTTGTGSITTAYAFYAPAPSASTAGTIGTYYGLYLANPTAASTNYAIYSAGGTSYFAGNIGIGSATPNYKLDVNGDVSIATSSALRFGATSVCTSAGCTSVSDRTLKKNIVPLEDSLAKILRLSGVQFDFIDGKRFTEKHQIGVIAQDVEKIFPEVVLKDPVTGLRTVAYDHLVAPLLEAVKTIHERLIALEQGKAEALAQGRVIASVARENADLRERLEGMRLENEDLRKRLEKIEARLAPN